MDVKVRLQPISMTGYCIFVVEEPTSTNIVPAVSITMRTDIAEYLQQCVEESQWNRDFGVEEY